MQVFHRALSLAPLCALLCLSGCDGDTPSETDAGALVDAGRSDGGLTTESDSGSDAGPPEEDASVLLCADDDTRAGESVCGLNDRGALQDICRGGAWETSTRCLDPDDCVDTQTRNSATFCGPHGVLVETCVSGSWLEGSECNDTPECFSGRMRTGTTACGLNGRGLLDQHCILEFWQDTETCTDPDTCLDTATQTLTDVCGLNTRGDIDQTCILGAWSGDTCADPEVCIDAANQTLTDVCGFNMRGDIEQSCVAGAWVGDTCADPDACEDDVTRDQSCWEGRGSQSELCTRGQWAVSDACGLTGLYRASVDSSGVQGDGQSDGGAFLSADGRYVVFSSGASNLVATDINDNYDIFLHDVQTGATTLIGTGPGGVQDNRGPNNPVLSGDGRFAVFPSPGTNLVVGDTNSSWDIFVYEIATGTMQRASVNSAGVQADGTSVTPSVSADGRFVAFASVAGNLVANDTNGVRDIFVRDLVGERTTRVNMGPMGAQANATSSSPSISADGRYVAFTSTATNLVTGDSNGADDVFVRDTELNITARVSVNSSGIEAASSGSVSAELSGDGRFVVFSSTAPDLVSDDTNGVMDIFVRDRQMGTTVLVSIDSAGAQGNASSSRAWISSDGQIIAFRSAATNLVASDVNGQTDIFVHNRQSGETIRVNQDSAGSGADGTNYSPRLSADGRHVVFFSFGSNLVPGDTNGSADVFIAPIR